MFSHINNKLFSKDQIIEGLEELHALLVDFDNKKIDVPTEDLITILRAMTSACNQHLESNNISTFDLVTGWLKYLSIFRIGVITKIAKSNSELQNCQLDSLKLMKTIIKMINLDELYDAQKDKIENLIRSRLINIENAQQIDTKTLSYSTAALLKTNIFLKLFSENDEIEIKLDLLTFYSVNLICAITYTTSENKTKFIAHFNVLRDHLVELLENDKAFYSQSALSLMPGRQSGLFSSLAANYVLTLFQTNYALLNLDLNICYTNKKTGSITIDLSSPIENIEGTIIRKVEQQEMLDFFIPLDLLFFKLSALSNITLSTYKEMYAKACDGSLEHLNNIKLKNEELQQAIKMLLNNYEYILSNLFFLFECKQKLEVEQIQTVQEIVNLMAEDQVKGVLESQELSINGTKLRKNMAQHYTVKPLIKTLSRSKESPINKTLLKCLSLLPYLIITYNRSKQYHTEQNSVTKFNKILTKFALLSNAYYESKFLDKNKLDSDYNTYFEEYAKKHKKPFKDIFGLMSTIYNDLHHANNIDIVKVNVNLNHLDSLIESIYKSLGYLSINAAQWLNTYTKDQVSYFNDANDLYIWFKQDIHKDIFITQLIALKKLHNNHDCFTHNEDGSVIIHQFRHSDFFNTSTLKSACFKALKPVKKEQFDASQVIKTGPTVYVQEEPKKSPPRQKFSANESRASQTNKIKAQLKDKNKAKEQRELEKLNKKKQKQAEQAAKAQARLQTTTENNNNNQNTPTRATTILDTTLTCGSMASQPTPATTHPQILEIVNTGRDDNKPKFPRPISDDIPELGSSLNHHLKQLDSAYNEIQKDPNIANNLSMRYFVLYHGIRMLEAALLVASTLGINRSSELYKQILSLRNMLADRIDYFLDPIETDKDFLSNEMAFTSIFCKLESIALRLQCFYTNLAEQRPLPIVLTNNPIYNKLCPYASKNDFTIQTPPRETAYELLTAIKSKCLDRLKLYMGKAQHSYELNNPFIAATIKMLLCEIGGLARRIRDNHVELASQLLSTDLSFALYPDAYTLNDNESTSKQHKNKRVKKRILPFLKHLGADTVANKLDALTLGDFLTLLIEIRNRIGHDEKSTEEQDFPEEITIELAFDIAKHLFVERGKKGTRIEELETIISQLTPEDKIIKRLDPNAFSFQPKFYQPTPRPMSAIVKKPMSITSEAFTPTAMKNANNTTTPTLFNTNNRETTQSAQQDSLESKLTTIKSNSNSSVT